MSGIAHVGAGLGVDADGEQGDKGGMDYCREEGMEDMADVHYSFAEEQEDG